MACLETEYFNGADGKCYPKTGTGTAVSESKYDGSSSIWGYVPGALTGVASVIASLKGTNTAPVTNIYQSGTGSGNMMMYVIGGILLLIVLFVVLKMGGKK